MIKVEEWRVQVEGKKPLVLSELGMLISAMCDHGYEKEEVQEAVNIAFMSEEELHEEAKRRAAKLFNEFNQDSLIKALAIHLSQMPESERKKYEDMLNDNKV